MRNLKLMVLPLLALAAGASSVRAQACLGLPSFTTGSVHLNLAAESPDSAKAYAIGIGAGRPNSLFANIGGSQVSFDGFDGKATSGFLEFGYQKQVSKAQICPIAGASIGKGPDDELAGIKVTSSSATAGLALGLALGSNALRVIPNAAVRYEYLSQTSEETGLGSQTDKYNSGIVDVGFALVFADRFSVQPLMHIPISGDDTKTSFGVFAAFSFGWKAK